jgi:hypothetical protein
MPQEPVLNPSGLARAVERIASFVPGYSGYKTRERLREEDRALRDAVVRQLGLALGRLERALASSIRDLPSPDVEDADRLLRGLNRQRDRIRFAPTGYASLFARKRIEQHELQGLIALDAQLWAALSALEEAAEIWDTTSRRGTPGWPHENLRETLDEIDDVINERESLLRS